MRKDTVLSAVSLILLIYSFILTIENWEIMIRLEISNPEFLKTATTGTVGLLIGSWLISRKNEIK